MADQILEVLNDAEKLREVTKASFDLVDVNKSGTIDKSELRTALSEIAKEFNLPPISDEDLNEAMSKLDTDSSGTLEVPEFENLVRGILEALAEALSD